MAKVTANYEVVFVVDPAQGEEAVATQVNNFKTLIEQNASNVEVEEWVPASWLIPSTTRPRATTCW